MFMPVFDIINKGQPYHRRTSATYNRLITQILIVVMGNSMPCIKYRKIEFLKLNKIFLILIMIFPGKYQI